MNNSILELFHKRNMSDNFKKLNCYQDEAPPDHTRILSSTNIIKSRNWLN